MEESRVEVVIRIRPRLDQFGERYDVDCCRKIDEENIYLSNPDDPVWEDKHRSTFAFNNVFDEDDGQQDLYEAAQKMVDCALFDGYHATIFTYGQTGSGKTYTIIGDTENTEQELVTPQSGIFLRALADMFDYQQQQQQEGRNHVVFTVSIVEIYCDEVFDLLNKKKPLQIRVRGSFDDLPDVTYRVVENLKEASDIFQVGLQQRAVGAHALNEVSSRSHALFIVDVYHQQITDDTQTPPDPVALGGAAGVEQAMKSGQLQHAIKHARLSLIDLAGSERVSKSRVEAQHLKETQAINTSLTCLGKVINGLEQQDVSSSSSSGNHLPFRDSKLTRLLKKSFVDPTSRLMLITNLAPTSKNFAETWSSIKFADRVKGLQTKPNFGVSASILDDCDYLDLLKEMETLSTEIRVARASGHVPYCIAKHACCDTTTTTASITEKTTICQNLSTELQKEQTASLQCQKELEKMVLIGTALCHHSDHHHPHSVTDNRTDSDKVKTSFVNTHVHTVTDSSNITMGQQGKSKEEEADDDDEGGSSGCIIAAHQDSKCLEIEVQYAQQQSTMMQDDMEAAQTYCQTVKSQAKTVKRIAKQAELELCKLQEKLSALSVPAISAEFNTLTQEVLELDIEWAEFQSRVEVESEISSSGNSSPTMSPAWVKRQDTADTMSSHWISTDNSFTTNELKPGSILLDNLECETFSTHEDNFMQSDETLGDVGRLPSDCLSPGFADTLNTYSFPVMTSNSTTTLGSEGATECTSDDDDDVSSAVSTVSIEPLPEPIEISCPSTAPPSTPAAPPGGQDETDDSQFSSSNSQLKELKSCLSWRSKKLGPVTPIELPESPVRQKSVVIASPSTGDVHMYSRESLESSSTDNTTNALSPLNQSHLLYNNAPVNTFPSQPTPFSVGMNSFNSPHSSATLSTEATLILLHLEEIKTGQEIHSADVSYLVKQIQRHGTVEQDDTPTREQIKLASTTLAAISSIAERSHQHRAKLLTLELIPSLVTTMTALPNSAAVAGQGTAALLHLAREGVALQQISECGGIQLVVSIMKNHASNWSVLTVANAALWSFGATKKNKKRICEAGAVQVIVNSMSRFPSKVDLLIRANAALCNLAVSAEIFKEIADSGGIQQILNSMCTFPTHAELLSSGCVAISNLSVHPSINTQLIKGGGIAAVLDSIKRFSTNLPLMCRGLAALCSLALSDTAKVAISSEGGVDVIIRCMQQFCGNAVVLTKGFATLWNLSENKQVRKQIKDKGGHELAKKTLKQFPHNVELLREAMGYLSGKKFSK